MYQIIEVIMSFISNKKDKTIYTNIINNDFQNIENISFKSSEKNDSIFLKSIVV